MKEYKVLSQTDFYVLAECDGDIIQFPPMAEKVETLLVDKDANGVPHICKEAEPEVTEEIIEKPKRRRKVKEIE